MGMVLIPLLLVFLGIFSPIKCQFARGYQPPPTAVEPSKFIHEDPEEAYRAKTRSFADVGTRNFHPPAPQPEFDAPETPLQILRPPGARPPLPPPSPPRFQQQRHGNAFHAPSQMPQSPGLPPLWVNPQKRISREQQMQMRRAASEWAQRRSPMRSEGSHSHILFSPPKATTGPMGPTRSLQPHEPISIFLHALLLPKNATTPHISRPHQVSLPDGMGTFINPHVIVKEVDRNTLEILRGRRKKSDASSNVVQVDAMVGSTDPRMDKKLVVAVDRELDRTIPRVLELMDRDNEKNGMNEQLRKDLESTLVEEIGKHLGETLEEVGDGVTSEDLDKIIEEGFNEVEVEEETTTQVTTMTTTHGKVTEQHMPAMVSRAPPARPPMMPHMPPGRPPMMPHMPPERPPMMPHMPPKRPPMMPHMPSEGPPMMPHMPPERPPMMPHMPPERPPMMPHMPSEGPPMMPHMLPERPPTMPHMPPERPPMMPHIPSEGPPMMPHMPPERPPTMPHMPSEGPHMMPHMPPERPPMMPHMPPEGPSMMPHMPPERPPMMPHMPPEGPPMMTLPVRPPMVTHVPASRPPTTPRHPSIATTTPGTTTPRFDEESESAFDMSSEMTAAPSTRSSAMKSTHTTTTPRTQTTPASTTTPRTTQTTTTRRTTTKPVRPAEKITKAPETGFNEDETMEKDHGVVTTAPIRIDEPTPRPVQGRVESTTEKAEETHPLITFKPVSRTPTPPSPSTVTHVPSTSSSRPTVTSRPISQATQSTTARHLETTAVAQTQSRPPTQATTIETVQPQTVPSRAPIQTFSPSTPTPQPETRPTHATLLPKAQPEEHLPAHPLPPHVDTERPPLQTQPPRHEMVSVPKVPCPSSNDPSDDRKVDVVFLVDSSSSFTQYKYSQALHIVHDTVTRFNNVGPGGVQVSLIQFNLEPYLEFSLRRHNCRQFVMDDIADTEYMRGATKLGKAIDKVTKFAFTRARGDREDAENVLVVITDGMTDDDVMTPAKAARDLGIHMLVVSSPDADPPILMDLTGDANENLLLLGSTSDRLLAKKLANMILDLAVEPLSTARPQWETAPMFTDFTSSTSPPTPVSIASPTPTPTQPPTPTLIPSSRPTQARPLWTTPVQAPSREPETETEPAEETSELPFVPSGETYFQPPFGNPSESTGSTNEILVTVPLPEWVEEPSTTVGYSNVDFSATAAAPARPVWKLNTETTQNYGLQTTTPEPYVETKLQTVGYEKAAPPDNSYEEMQQPDTPAPSPEITEQPYYVPNQGGSTYEHLPEGNRKNVGGAGVSRPSIAQTPIISPDALSMQCSHTGFQVSVLVPPRFVGIIAVKGKEHDPQCSQKVDRHLYAGPHTVTMSVKVKECGAVSISSQNPAGVNTSVVINILHNGELLTVSDRSYLLQCFSPVLHDESLETRLNVRPTSRMIAETINLQSVPPKCSYTIRKDGPEGSIAGSAQLGETVYHTWTCKGTEDSNDVYGMIVKDCYATSDVHRQFPLIDSSGCSADIAVLSDPIYSNSSLTAFAESKAFGFEGDEALRFVCRVSLCTRDGDGCEGVTPPRCGGNSGSYLLSRVIRRDGDSAMESALTSDLYTQVSVSSSGTSSLKRAVNAILHNSTISAVCLVTVFAVICTALLARYSHRAHRDDTSSGYANADNQSQLDSVTSDDEDSRQRFQQFLHNFDRQQYV